MSTLRLGRARRIGHDEPVDLVLRDGRIASVGRPVAAEEEIDLNGRVVMPGLWDQHVHLTQWALARRRLDVSSAASASQVVALVRDRLATDPPPLLVGHGFRDGLWPDVPTVAALDAAAGDVPVVLVSGDLHCAWASSAGLRHLGAPTVDGLLREGAWLPLQGVVDRLPVDESDALVAAATRHAATLGVVGVVDFEVADNLAVWRRRAASAPPSVRVRAGVWADYLDRVLHADLHTGDRVVGLVEQGPLKVIVDGSLNTRTAWCDAPYPGSSSHGVLSVPATTLEPLVAHAHAHGLRAAVHAIGDAANRLALDAFARTGARGSIEHAQLVAPGDLARFAALGVTASIQPQHAVDDRHVADRHWPGRDAFAYAELHRAGATLALGSDAPVAALDPWAAIDAAVWRAGPGERPWHPEQRLAPLTALAASVDGRPLGLRVGDPADLVVLDDDPLALAVTPGALRATRVAGTLTGGTWTHPLSA